MGYTISFFINGYGQQPNSISNVNTIPELPILVEDGFIFDGWYLDEDLTTAVEVGSPVESDIILYASWTRQRAGWGSYSGTDTSTYAIDPNMNITGPGGTSPEITPDVGGGGTSGVSCYRGGNSWFNDYLGGAKSTLYSNSVTYSIWPYTDFTNYIGGGMTMRLPIKSSTDDEWVETLSLDYWYNDNGTKKQITCVKPGTRPTFTRKIFSCDSNNASSTYGTHTVIEVYRIVNTTNNTYKLKFVTKTTSGTSKSTKEWEPNLTLDGEVPRHIILLLQSAGGGGYKNGGSRGGGGGASGNIMAGVFKIDNLVGIDNSSWSSSYPALKIYVPTVASPGSDGGECYVMYPTSQAGTPTYTKICSIEGGQGCGSTSGAGGSGTSGVTSISDLYGRGSYDGRTTSYNYWWSLPIRTAGYSYNLVTAPGSNFGGNGYSSSTSGPGENSANTYIYSSTVKIGSASSPALATSASDLYINLPEVSGGSRGDYGGGGGASHLAAGGNGATSKTGSATSGTKGSGGGGSCQGTAGSGGAGCVYIYI